MAGVHSFGNIILFGKAQSGTGSMKVGPGGMTWKGKSGRVENIEPGKIKSAKWFPTAGGSGMKIITEDYDMKFLGFRSVDLEPLKELFKNSFGVEIETISRSLEGWNFGEIEVEGGSLTFKVEDKLACDLDLSTVSGVNLSGKNEVTLEFHQQDNVQGANETLVEMRFQVPGEDSTMANDLKEEILKKAAVESDKDKPIALLEQVAFVVPRGRFNFALSKNFLSLESGTNFRRYKILYSNIVRLFMLPKPGGRNTALVISLDPPIHQGKTIYAHLVMQFDTEDEIDLELNLTDELKEKHKGKLQEIMSGPTYDVLGHVSKVLMDKRITVPGKSFSAYQHLGTDAPPDRAVRCSFLSNEGFLFPLQQSFFFIHKPPIYLRFGDIASVQFARYHDTTAQAKTFDLVVTTLTGKIYQFINIDRREYNELHRFILSKEQLVLQTSKEEKEQLRARAAMAAEESEGDSEEEEDPYLAKVQREGREESDSDDDDFNPDAAESEDDDFESGDDMLDVHESADLKKKKKKKQRTE